MMKTILLAILVAACGGGSSRPAPTTPPPGDPVPMKEPAAAGPAAPTGPTRPAEPPAPDPAKIKAELLAAETAAFEKARPVFDRYCASCHTKGGKLATAKKLDHVDMTAYPFGGHHAMEISGAIRKALGIGGGKPTMPFNNKGAVKGDDLALVAAWADAFDASHQGGAHDGHDGHEHHEH
jgi:mono/diheme cytochrome c family protein